MTRTQLQLRWLLIAAACSCAYAQLSSPHKNDSDLNIANNKYLQRQNTADAAVPLL